jgi:hypothetical protein
METSKFLKAEKPVPHRYIVKLKDDVVPKHLSIESKLEGGVFNMIKAFVAAYHYRYRFGPA